MHVLVCKLGPRPDVFPGPIQGFNSQPGGSITPRSKISRFSGNHPVIKAKGNNGYAMDPIA